MVKAEPGARTFGGLHRHNQAGDKVMLAALAVSEQEEEASLLAAAAAAADPVLSTKFAQQEKAATHVRRKTHGAEAMQSVMLNDNSSRVSYCRTTRLRNTLRELQ